MQTDPNSPPPEPQSTTAPYLGEPYWASKQGKEAVADILDRIDNYYLFLNASGVRARWIDSYHTYYRAADTLGQLTVGGAAGELTEISVNQLRNIMQHLFSIITQQDLAFECRATNTDRASMVQTILGNNLLEYYLQHDGLKEVVNDAIEKSLLFGEGFVQLSWDANSGDVVSADVETGKEIRAGDPKFCALGPIDIARDFSQDAASKCEWFAVRSWVNKWDLAAKYPEFANDIVNLDSEWYQFPRNYRFGYIWRGLESDLIPKWTFYHGKTDAMPDGRILEFVGEDIVLSDSVLVFEEVPIYRVTTANQQGTILGYSVIEECKPIQKALDGCDSTILTNIATFGVQNILSKKGNGTTIQALAGGLNLVEYDGNAEDAPRALEMLAISPVIPEWRANLVHDMETVSAVSSVARGEPPEGVHSGSALALLANQTLQFSATLQRERAKLMQDIGTALLRMLRLFANTPRIAKIAGKANRQFMKEFVGDDLSEIDRVEVDLGNPLMRTTAGRVQIADSLLANPRIQITAQEYLTLITTGKLEPMYERETHEMLRIRAENEAMQDARPVRALVTDNHPLDISEHLSVLANPEIRDGSPANEMFIQNVLAHIQEHFNLWRTADPALLMAAGVPPPPPPPMLGPPPGALPPPGAHGAPPHGLPPHKPGIPPVADNQNPTATKAGAIQAPRPPQMPKDAQTGARFSGQPPQ